MVYLVGNEGSQRISVPSSRGLGRRPLKAVTPVRIRSGLPSTTERADHQGLLFPRFAPAPPLIAGRWGGQPVMLGWPFSRWPVKRRDQAESALLVTVKSYQPLETKAEVRSPDQLPPAVTAWVCEPLV